MLQILKVGLAIRLLLYLCFIMHLHCHSVSSIFVVMIQTQKILKIDMNDFFLILWQIVVNSTDIQRFDFHFFLCLIIY